MPVRQSIVILQDSERTTITEALSGRPVEDMIKQLRDSLKQPNSAILALVRAKTVTPDMATKAGEALATRRQALHALRKTDLAGDQLDALIGSCEAAEKVCREALDAFGPGVEGARHEALSMGGVAEPAQARPAGLVE